MSDRYSRLYQAVLAVLAERDPLNLADPEISLADEYEAEAREIARRVLGASVGAVDLPALIQAVFVEQFEAPVSDEALAAIVQTAI